MKMSTLGRTMFDVSGKSALVTGGTGGIGVAIANELAAAGCCVRAADLSSASVASDLDHQIEVLPLDISDMRSIDGLIQRLDRLDILVNGAGIIRREAEYDLETFEQVIDINLTGTMRMCTACKPLLAARGGSIVNVASMLSFFGHGLAPAYGASKGGVAQLTKSLAVGWATDKIRVNAIAPGWIVTPLTQTLQDDPARSAAIVARTPLGRWGRPEDVAGAVIFLCSPAAAFITGVILPVDGGYLVA
jgi:NAD(P)-dependent dehydrogenase (short-subunit alcohol dehydrogenase family)